LRILQLAPFARLPWLVHGFSTRAGGGSDLDGSKVLNLGFMKWDKPENVNENRESLQAALAAADLALVPLEQIHSALLRPLSDSPKQPRPPTRPAFCWPSKPPTASRFCSSIPKNALLPPFTPAGEARSPASLKKPQGACTTNTAASPRGF